MSDNAVYRVRGVEGVDWAVRLYKGMARARKPNGLFRQVILLGIDDQSLVGVPRTILMADLASLRRPSAVFIDKAGYESLWPGEPFVIGREIEMNDHRAVVVGICETSAFRRPRRREILTRRDLYRPPAVGREDFMEPASWRSRPGARP